MRVFLSRLRHLALLLPSSCECASSASRALDLPRLVLWMAHSVISVMKLADLLASMLFSALLSLMLLPASSSVENARRLAGDLSTNL